jgi:hypothetical protein
MSTNNLNDPKNIAGLSNLIEDDDLESTMDLAELEQEIARGAIVEVSEEVNVADEYRKEMDRLSRNFDIAPQPHEFSQSFEPSQNTSTSYSHNYSNNQSSPAMSGIGHSPPRSPFLEPILSRDAYNSPKYTSTNANTQSNDYSSHSVINDSQLNFMTQEETKQNKINQVLRGIDDNELEFSIEKEKEEDDKASLLEQIDMLKITLEDDGVDISGVPSLNKQSTMKDVQNVYKILRLKNDRNRYCSFAEELILAGAYGLEYIFDGKKVWFGRTPDLTDWSSTIKVKLRRMRYETSTFVQEIMQEYNMSAGMRLALELIPSMFLYSRNRRLAQDDNLVSDDEYKNAIGKLNSM